MASIIRRSNELQQSVGGMLERGQRRHLQRNELLSSLYQNQSYLRHIQDLNDRYGADAIDPRPLAEMDRLIVAAIHTSTPRSIVQQLDKVRGFLPTTSRDPTLAAILQDFNGELARAGAALGAAGGERFGHWLVYVSHQGAGGAAQQRY